MNKEIRETFEEIFDTEYFTYDDRFDRYLVDIKVGQKVNHIDQLNKRMQILNANWQGFKARDEIDRLNLKINEELDYLEDQRENHVNKDDDSYIDLVARIDTLIDVMDWIEEINK